MHAGRRIERQGASTPGKESSCEVEAKWKTEAKKLSGRHELLQEWIEAALPIDTVTHDKGRVLQGPAGLPTGNESDQGLNSSHVTLS